ncbi:sterol esterase Tgl1p [Trichomonascus vanleenenianus]|uniref:sterol esterase n=1 Tax=Trichomonascus vanleenenianus TaxID=2268995 RepID=UPI003EC9FE5D
MYVPVLSRLRALEWPVLIFSLFLVVFESVVLFVTTLLPGPVIRLFDRVVKRLFRRFSSPPEPNDPHTTIAKAIASSPGFIELCALFGYEAEEHIVKTQDGYLLGIHRIGGPRGSNWRSELTQRKKRPVVYLHHGLLMNSEVWIVNVEPQKCLPFVLADLGYDVWLGNNRGNKYSKKHVSRQPSDKEFWNFSMDDFALYDIPDTIEYILDCADKRSLSYIGFSQGSAQAFAALSIHPKLNSKVKLFIALAPAMAPPGLANQVVDSLMKATPQLIYLVFGKKAILKSTTFWQSIMYPPVFVRVIDLSLRFLFGWTGRNISNAQKTAAYAHLYSYTSVKSVVHWFQIIRNGRFHMFDDDVQSIFIEDKNFYKVAPFPTQNIMSPIVLVYGKTDSLVDINVMLHELPAGTAHVGIPYHEHLDIIWGDRVDALVFPYVLSALERVDGVTKERLKNE